MNIPFWILVSACTWTIGYSCAKHGQRKKEKYNGWSSLLASIIEIVLIIWAIRIGGV